MSTADRTYAALSTIDSVESELHRIASAFSTTGNATMWEKLHAMADALESARHELRAVHGEMLAQQVETGQEGTTNLLKLGMALLTPKEAPSG